MTDEENEKKRTTATSEPDFNNNLNQIESKNNEFIVIPAKQNLNFFQKKWKLISILIFLIILFCGSAAGYFLYFSSESSDKKNLTIQEPDRKITISTFVANSPTIFVNITSTTTPTPLKMQNALSLTSKGEVEVDNSVKVNLISAYLKEDKILTKYILKNSSSSDQKIFYMMFEIESSEAFNTSTQHFFNSKGQPFDGEIILSPNEEKEVEITFNKVPQPFSWYYWGTNKRFTLGFLE